MLIDGMRAPGRYGAKGRNVGLKRIKVRDEDGYDKVPTGKVSHGKDLRNRGLNWWDKTENNVSIAPLRRVLTQHLGCRWSTLRAKLLADTRPVDRQMIAANVDWLVAAGADVEMVKGKPHQKAQSRHGPCTIFERFYEHPVTGLLCANKREKWEWKKPVDLEAPFEIDGVSYVIKNGLWYRRIVTTRVETVMPEDPSRARPQTLATVVETVVLRQISGKERDRLVAKVA